MNHLPSQTKRSPRTTGLIVLTCVVLAFPMLRSARADYRWENRLPIGNPLTGVVAFAEDDVWVVGELGSVLHWDGTAWETLWGVRALGDDDITGVWGSLSSDMWFCTASGNVFHWDGSSWSADSLGTALHGIWGSSSTSVWVVGSSGTIQHWDGSSWSSQTSGTSETLYGIWGTSAMTVWAVGGNGTILSWNGLSWISLTSGTTNTLRAISGTSSSDLWAVGNSGTALHSTDGLSWSSEPTGETSALYGVAATASNTVYAVGAYGRIYLWDGSGWSRMTSPTGQSFSAIAADASGSGRCWAAGYYGTIVTLEDGTWTELSSGEMPSLRDVSMLNAHSGFAVGTGGVIYSRKEGRWEAMDSGTTESLFGVWYAGADLAFAVGTGGTILRWDGSAWSAETSGTAETLNAIHGWASGEAVVVGVGPTILEYDGSSWSSGTAPTGLIGNPTDVWGPDPDTLFVVSDQGEVATWDGSSWSVTTPTVQILNAVWGRAEDDVFAAGDGGVVIHWDGSSWLDISDPTVTTERRGLGGNAAALIVVDTHGRVQRLTTAGGWEPPFDLCDPGTLQAVGSGGPFFWFVGTYGTIVRYGPPAIDAEPSATVEGETGTIVVRLSSPRTSATTVDYQTADRTAHSGSDYTAGNGTVTFAPGETVASVPVATLDDSSEEPDETLAVLLGNSSGPVIGDGMATLTIEDDGDAPSELSVAAAAATEGAGVLAVTVTATPASGYTISFHLQSFDGTAGHGLDYFGRSIDVDIPPGVTTVSRNFALIDDSWEEPDETFTVTLSDPVHATLGSDSATMTILNDDTCGWGGDMDADCDAEADDLAILIRKIGEVGLLTAGDPDCDDDFSVTTGDVTCLVGEIFVGP